MKKSRLLFFFFLFSFFFSFLACEKKAPVETVESNPQVSVHSIPTSIKMNSTTPVLFMAKVSDPQGLGNISHVDFGFGNINDLALIAPQPMYDTGLDGDIIKGDGVYTYRLIPENSIGSTGEYTASFQAFDRDGNESEIIQDSVLVEAGGDGVAPSILSVEFPETLIIQSDTVVTLVVLAEDEDGDLDGVEVKILPVNSHQSIFIDSLRSVNDTFQKEINTSIFTLIDSDYIFRLQAFDMVGNISLPVTRISHIQRTTGNDPPQVLSVTAPDTVSKSGQTNFLIEAEVTDPQGLDDIARVLLNSFRPDGTPAGGNPFTLLDNGIGGDVTADDGIYSLRVGFDQSNANGTYRFEIHAEDQAGEKSNVVIHLITLTN